MGKLKSDEYRRIVKTIVKAVIKKGATHIRAQDADIMATMVARNIHARMYGANVDGVNSPLWRCDCEPDIDATELLKGTENV